MPDRTLSDLRDYLIRLAVHPSDRGLLQARDQLIKLYIGPRVGEFWDLIIRFDETVTQRRKDGSIRRYSTARSLLLDAARHLEERENREAETA